LSSDCPQKNRRRGRGQYRLEGLLPGEYEVAAFVGDDEARGLRMRPVASRGDRALKVTVSAGQTTRVSLKACE
jgi:hypothetical protein